MKVLASGLNTQLSSGSSTLAFGLLITRADGAVYAFTSASDNQLINGVVYQSAPGLDVSNIKHSAGLAVDNLELSTLDDGTTFSRVDVLNGLWDNANFSLFRFNYRNVSDGTEPLLSGIIGSVRILRNTIVAELRGYQQYLQQTVGIATSKNCRARLGDSSCKVAMASHTFTGSVTSVTDNQTFGDSARTQADDWFTEGVLTFTSGANKGASQKVKAYASKAFTLSLGMWAPIVVGDTYTVTSGCQKRLVEDCKTKFSNVVNFQGEPHVPGIDALSKVKSP